MERIPFELFEQADNERYELERLRELSNTELEAFINDSLEHIEQVGGLIGLTVQVLQERGFNVNFGTENE